MVVDSCEQTPGVNLCSSAAVVPVLLRALEDRAALPHEEEVYLE
jgi:hypothetical protein